MGGELRGVRIRAVLLLLPYSDGFLQAFQERVDLVEDFGHFQD
jgi:hypothetical protein